MSERATADEFMRVADYIEEVGTTCPNTSLRPGAEWAAAVLRNEANNLLDPVPSSARAGDHDRKAEA